ncbi:MAG: hypothetical protein IPM24_05830 [Bryobacterales bacterium]|nr:hypothetical protein [Bryobacterales bacterium]
MMFRKMFFFSAEGRRMAQAETSQYLLRDLPNEDLYFHVKSIDNSRLVRLADPEASGECLSTIGAASAAAVLLVTSLIPSVGSIMAGYRLEALKAEEQRLQNQQRTLEVRESSLRSVERLEQLARDRRMGPPKAGQVVHLNTPPRASAGEVASNLPAAKN